MKIIRFIKETTFVVTKGEDTLISMPTTIFVLLMFFFWQLLIPAILIAMFLGAEIFFDGVEKEDGVKGDGSN